MTSLLIDDPGPLADLDRARALLAGAGLDAVVASTPDSVFHLTAHAAYDSGQPGGANGFAVVPAVVGLTPALIAAAGSRLQLIDFPAAVRDVVVFGGFHVAGAPTPARSEADAVAALVVALGERRLTGARLGVELSALPTGLHARLVAALPDAELVEAGPLLTALRRRKTDREIARQREATAVVERAITTALYEAEPGQTERDVDRRIRDLLADGLVEPSSVFVGASERGAYVLSWATDRVLVPGDLIRVDVTATYGGYHADLSRNVAVGHATDEQRRLYAIVREALEASIAAVGAGVPVRDVFEAGFRVARERGLSDFERHHVGHGIGLLVHESPDLDRSEETIDAPSVLSVEMPYYRHGHAGYSPEDAVLVTETGVERWTTAPFDLPVVGR